MAQAYYDRVGYGHWAMSIRKNQKRENLLKSPGSQAANLNCRSRQNILTPDITLFAKSWT